MSRRIIVTCTLLALLVPFAVVAQGEEEAKTSYAYGTYFECDNSREWLADRIIKDDYAPHYDAAVEDGTMTAWGYLAHHTGGKWRRVLYRVAPTLDAAIESLGAVADKVDPQAAAEFGAICSTHDDYIWRSVTGSAGAEIAQERGEVGFSAYFICDEAKETEADKIVKEVFAPIYNEHVAAGNLVSWGWMEHWVGGKYRRLSTMTATDMSKLISARDAIIEAIVAAGDASQKFGEICNGHTDYMWNIQHETP